MKLDSLHLNNQRNAGHYQFQTDFNESIIKYTPLALGIVDAYKIWLPLYHDEGVALVAIKGSATTDQIGAANIDRNSTFRGCTDSVHSSLKHFNPEVREAAKRVMVILDSYGNLAAKPDDEESGLMSSLIADLRTKTGTDLVILTIVDWIAELERQNNVFIALEATRNSEEAKKTELRMKLVRVDVDGAYQKIRERINALIVVNGEAAYSEFVKEVNARIGRASDAMALSKGHDKKPATI